eukprot:CAMPEP_0202455426 /NCGR_PEP_ID=MMETSP1360-20130828/12961_1 /ASSEMBLY_ACC=CAM_ASM_000848 /TAXON_ID=515479 /ORGANISM="Licmophora paradoxa, Strain CCMP2313" /LENGTH=175 /DNA_ID=CAMNT_0049075011 /DNA_START=24 /DNA_END=551 /DNA_ORIENTATION=-
MSNMSNTISSRDEQHPPERLQRTNATTKFMIPGINCRARCLMMDNNNNHYQKERERTFFCERMVEIQKPAPKRRHSSFEPNQRPSAFFIPGITGTARCLQETKEKKNRQKQNRPDNQKQIRRKHSELCNSSLIVNSEINTICQSPVAVRPGITVRRYRSASNLEFDKLTRIQSQN